MTDSASTIIIFKGSSQYDASRVFLDDFDKAYRKLGYRTVVIDLRDQGETSVEIFRETLQTGNVLFAIGINAHGQFTTPEGKSIYDIAQIPHVSWLMDHPVYHLERIENIGKDFGVVGVVDRDHGEFLSAAVAPPPASLFLPHGGNPGSEAQPGERDLDVIFSGTGVDPETIRAQWSEADSQKKQAYETGVELSLADPKLRLMDMATQVFTKLSFSPDRNSFVDVMLNVERYLRAADRYQVLKSLDEAGQPVHVYGNGWEFAKFKTHELHASVPYNDSIELLKRSKIAINISAFFTDGAHDRVFSTMLGGALSATNTTDYLNELPGFTESALIYGPEQAPLHEQIKEALAIPTATQAKADQGKAFAEGGHTFAHRAKTLLDAVTEAFPAGQTD